MSEKHYYIYKKGDIRELIYLDYNKLKGFNFKPQNNVKYDGVVVNKMVIIKPSMIEKVLRRKIKNKLNLYLSLIIKYIEESDSSSDDTIREALNDLTRYKSIINNKYKKYLDKKYLEFLEKKILVLEYELNAKIINIKYEELEEEKNTHKSR